MTTTVNIEAGQSGADQLAAHKVRLYARNVWRAAERSTMLASTVLANLNFSEKGVAFTDNTYARTGPKDVGSDEFVSHDTHRIKKGSRQATFGDKYDSTMVGSRERAEELTDPTNEVVAAHGEGLGLFRDKFILATMFADVQEAVDGGTDAVAHQWTTKAFPAGQIVGVSENTFYANKAKGATAPATPDTGLTVAKLFKARSLMAKAKMRGRRILVCTEDDILNLLTDDRLTTIEINQIRALVDGDNKRFMGFDFHQVHPDAQVGNGTATAEIAAYWSDCYKYNERQLVSARVHERRDMHNNWEAYYRFQPSGLRRDDTSLAKIIVDQS